MVCIGEGRSASIWAPQARRRDTDKRLIEAWPRETRADRGRFERLKRTYVHGRCSDAYMMGVEDLEALSASVGRLMTDIEAVCQISRRRPEATFGSRLGKNRAALARRV